MHKRRSGRRINLNECVWLADFSLVELFCYHLLLLLLLLFSLLSVLILPPPHHVPPSLHSISYVVEPVKTDYDSFQSVSGWLLLLSSQDDGTRLVSGSSSNSIPLSCEARIVPQEGRSDRVFHR